MFLREPHRAVSSSQGNPAAEITRAEVQHGLARKLDPISMKQLTRSIPVNETIWERPLGEPCPWLQRRFFSWSRRRFGRPMVASKATIRSSTEYGVLLTYYSVLTGSPPYVLRTMSLVGRSAAPKRMFPVNDHHRANHRRRSREASRCFRRGDHRIGKPVPRQGMVRP